jgi:chemotaxis protein histidine kinase CheA
MMRNLGGDITLASELGQGTTIKLNLPKDLRQILAIQNGVTREPAGEAGQNCYD